MRRVKEFLIIKIDIFPSFFFSSKKVEQLVKFRQRDKKPASLNKYTKKLILKEVLTGFKVPK